MAVTLDDLRTIDVNKMVKQGAIVKNGFTSGAWSWSDRETGEVKSKIGYRSNTLSNDPYLQLHYTIVDTGEDVDCKIKLSFSSQPFGGKRIWFICPVSGRRVTKLYSVVGYSGYLSRHCLRYHYATQMQCDLGNAIDKKWKLLDKLGGQDKYWIKPKGMHQKTYDRLLNEYWEQEELCERLFFRRFGLLC